MKDYFLDNIIKILKKKEIRDEMNEFCRPLLLIILQEIYPYLYFSLAFIVINFILLLGIFYYIIRNNKLNS